MAVSSLLTNAKLSASQVSDDADSFGREQFSSLNYSLNAVALKTKFVRLPNCLTRHCQTDIS